MTTEVAHPLAASAADVLTAWHPSTETQRSLREAYLAALLTDPAMLWRSHRAGHLTVGGLVLNADASHVLLVLHPKAGMWLPPGGHLEPEDATLLEGALREVREETGVSDAVAHPAPVYLDAHPFSCRGEPSRHLNIGFAMRTPATPDGALPPVQISEESLDVRWWPLDALPQPRPARLEAELRAAALA